MNDVDWDHVFNSCVSCDELSECFYAVAYQCIDKFVPRFRVRHGGEHVGLKHHYPPKVKTCLRIKLRTWHLLKKFNTPALRQKYRELNKKCKSLILEAQRDHEESIIKSNNLGKFFSLAKSKLSGKKTIGTLINENGVHVTDAAGKAELLSNHLSRVLLLTINILIILLVLIDKITSTVSFSGQLLSKRL